MASTVTGFQTTSEVLTANGDTCFVSPTGTIDVAGANGVYWDTSVSSEKVVNQGYIFGENAVFGNATSNNEVYNYGRIDSDIICVVLQNRSFDTLANAGSISGSQTVDIDGNIVTISNSGIITGTSEGVIGNVSSSENIDNTGTISGHDESLKLLGTGAFSVHNSGKLAGDVDLSATSGGDAISNAGQIDGNVKLGSATTRSTAAAAASPAATSRAAARSIRSISATTARP